MARLIVKCPQCEHQESVMSSRPGMELPPCPRCDDFIRMTDVTPPAGQTTVISTAGSQTTEQQPHVALPKPVITPKRRDSRDFGPEPRN
jgi:ribosomal protein S27E